ncbi:hypothetical protein [Sphingobacterium thalpophilum]|uniref:hypothetical protein n=1 Tax=Sphingobacterium thalpophilum TaxID=259 RepID=UPI003C740D28
MSLNLFVSDYSNVQGLLIGKWVSQNQQSIKEINFSDGSFVNFRIQSKNKVFGYHWNYKISKVDQATRNIWVDIFNKELFDDSVKKNRGSIKIHFIDDERIEVLFTDEHNNKYDIAVLKKENIPVYR